MVAWFSTSATESVPDSEPKQKEEVPRRPLDIVFLQDATGSQGPYIVSARKAINTICEKVSLSAALSQGSIRFGLIAFRDHPPQDNSYVTKNFGFTANVEVMKKNLGSLIASGGGDGPEASTAALAEALNLQWAENAVKIVVLITDAPPHGIGEGRDGFPDGSPDPRQMAEHGISLYVIGCEPSLSQYRNAVDFYRALTQIASGRIVPLVNADQLGDYIIGSAIETIETEDLIGQFEHVILEDVYGQGKSVEEVTANIQKELNSKNVQLNTLNVEDIYEPSEIADKNVNIWMAAKTLESAKQEVQELAGPRVKRQFLNEKMRPGPPLHRIIYPASSGTYHSGPSICDARAYLPIACVDDTYTPSGSSSYAPEAPSSRPYASPFSSKKVDSTQARRVVIRSLSINAKVRAGGILQPKGIYADKGPTSIPPYTSGNNDSGSSM